MSTRESHGPFEKKVIPKKSKVMAKIQDIGRHLYYKQLLFCKTNKPMNTEAITTVDQQTPSKTDSEFCEESFPAPTKFRRQDPTSKQIIISTSNCEDHSRPSHFLAVHRAAVGKTVLKLEAANWTQDSGLSDAWMWDLPELPWGHNTS